MKEFYVCSNDKDVKVPYGNSTMVFWKRCDVSYAKCRAIRYFLKQPVKFQKIDYLSQQKYLFNFSPIVSIDEIRCHIQRAHEICQNCGR